MVNAVGCFVCVAILVSSVFTIANLLLRFVAIFNIYVLVNCIAYMAFIFL